MSTDGLPTGARPASWMACSYHSGSARRTASSSTASRPTWRSTTSAGTLPLRKPGTFMSRPSTSAAFRSSCSIAVGGTSTATRTRESDSSSVDVVRVAIGNMRSRPTACEGVDDSVATDAGDRPRAAPWSRGAAAGVGVTGPLGHLYSTVADLVVFAVCSLFTRARAAARRPLAHAGGGLA